MIVVRGYTLRSYLALMNSNSMSRGFSLLILVSLLGLAISASISDNFQTTTQAENGAVAYPHHSPFDWAPSSTRRTPVSSTSFGNKCNIGIDSAGQLHVHAGGLQNWVEVIYDTFATALDISASTSCVLSGASNGYYDKLRVVLTDTSAQSNTYYPDSATSTSSTWLVSSLNGPVNVASLSNWKFYIQGNCSNCVIDILFDGWSCS